ncbi:hypothetical protein AAG596_01105 [Citromicrobium bathyomarinum]|uniref:hypothetical protein n=1 Tax=Citromicrobium bathyomarinum TaxID=72174 RepID=UPI00315AC6AB
MNSSPILKKVVWIINPAGGVGKTLVTQVIEGLAQINGTDVVLASQDRGNQAIKHALSDANIIAANSLPKDAVRIISRVENRELFLIDVGANPSSEEYDPLPFGAALNAEITARGGNMVVVVPTTPLKIHGNKTAARTARDLLNEGFEVHVVKNHQNQSGGFDDLDVPIGVQVSELDHLPSGIMALVREHSGSIADLYLSPEPDYRLAGGHIGQWLLDASQQPVMQSVFDGNVSGLSIPEDRRPRQTMTGLEKLSHVTDQALTRNYGKYDAFHKLLNAGSDIEVLAAARAFQRAMAGHK